MQDLPASLLRQTLHVRGVALPNLGVSLVAVVVEVGVVVVVAVAVEVEEVIAVVLIEVVVLGEFR